MRARILAAVLLAAFAAPAQAAYPEKPIRFIVPSAPGGSVDVLMRILTQQLSTQMGVAFVVENKPGASFVPGTMDIVKAAQDGYTLGYGNIVSLAVNRTLLPTLPYDVEKDLTLVSNCVQVFNMLAVNNALPVRTVAELIDYARKNPGKLSNGSSGNGTTGHLGGELFKAMTGTEMVHVPYKGSAQAINDLISGNSEVMFDNVPSIGPHVKSGRVRGLGVSAPKRAAQFPGPADDRGGGRAGLRDQFLGRDDRARASFQGSYFEIACRDQKSPGTFRGGRALPAARRRARRRRAGGVPRAGPARDAECGRGDPALGRESRLDEIRAPDPQCDADRRHARAAL